MAGNLKIKSDKVWGNYRGLVEDNNDPLQHGRCRVRIYPLFKDMDADKLPWAVPAFSLFDGAGSGTGSFAVPAVGTMVFCFFEMGDVYQPVYFAEARDGVNGIISAPGIKQWITGQVQGGGRFTIQIDETAPAMRIVHPSSSTIALADADGNILISSQPGKITIQSNKDIDVTAVGNINITAAGNVVIKGAQVQINP